MSINILHTILTKFRYDGRDLAFAIEVDSPVLYEKDIDPKEKIANFTAPQSFMYY